MVPPGRRRPGPPWLPEASLGWRRSAGEQDGPTSQARTLRLDVGWKAEVKAMMDNNRKRMSAEETVVLVRSEEIESKQRRRSIGEIIFWIVTHVPGVLLIWHRVHMHRAGRVFLGTQTLTEDSAPGFSWVMIGLGIGGGAGGPWRALLEPAPVEVGALQSRDNFLQLW